MPDNDTMQAADTAMQLTGVHSGLKIEASGQSGTLSGSSSVSGQNGYKVALKKSTEGVPYVELTVATKEDVADPPTLIVSVQYQQTIEIPEVDLDVRYNSIPQDTQMQVACSETQFSIARQGISGSGLVGASGKDLGTFSSSIDLLLWIPRPGDLVSASSVSVNMSKIDSGTDGPVKKVLLQKFVLNLANTPPK